MKRIHIAALCLAACILGCGRGQHTFSDAFGIQLPEGVCIQHEYLFKRWDYNELSYYAILKGDHQGFVNLVRELNLSPANGNPLAFPSPNQDEAPWWNPPTMEEMIAISSNQYCWSREGRHGWERIIVQYTQTNILVYKYGIAGLADAR
jgi:hypothetical protein